MCDVRLNVGLAETPVAQYILNVIAKTAPDIDISLSNWFMSLQQGSLKNCSASCSYLVNWGFFKVSKNT